MLDRLETDEYYACTVDVDRPRCEQIRAQIEEINQEGCDEGCSWATDCGDPGPGCNPPFYYDQMGNQYHVDNSPYIVWKIFRKGSNEIMFCIEPEQMMDECQNYTTEPATLSAEVFTKISLAAMFYNESPSNEHYVAAQIYVWSVMGSNRTVNGRGVESYWPGLTQMIEDALAGALAPEEGEGEGDGESEIVETEVVEVEFEEDNIMTDLNGDITNHDMNDALTNEFFELEIDPMGSDGQDGNTSENATINDGSHSVEGENKNIWPSTKTYTVEPIVESTTEITGSEGGGLTGLGSFLMADYSQNLYSFDGALENGTTLATITVYEGDSYTTTLRTGDFSLTKVDEWNQNPGAGHVYRIWYAKEDPNGTAIDENGTRWSKYEPFVSEPDWNAGQTQSTYTTDASGKFTATGLPSGGNWNDGTPIGTYILQEVDTTNPYQLNGKQYVFTVSYNSTTSMTVTNHERIVELKINKFDIEEYGDDHHMMDEDLLLNGAEYSVFDISDVREDVFGQDAERTMRNYFVKVGASVDLSTFLADEIAKVAAEHDGVMPTIVPPEHCETFTWDEDTNTLTANKIDTLTVYFMNPDYYHEYEVWGQYTIYLVANDDSLCTGETCTIDGFRQFKGETGMGYVQLVDVLNHHLPVVNGWLTVYYDEACTKPYARYQADEFGMIDFTTSYVEFDENVEVNDDGDGIFYYQLIREWHDESNLSETNGHPALGDSLEGYYYSDSDHIAHVGQSGHVNLVTYSITSRELIAGKDEEKGQLTIGNLHHSREYLICESKKPDKYDLVDDNATEHNACFIYSTGGNTYPEGTITNTIEKMNKKTRGDLILEKLNEWYDPDTNNVTFELYHAAIKDWNDDIDPETILNDQLDNRNDWDLNYDNVIFCDYGYTYDPERRVCVYDGKSEIEDNDNESIQYVSLEQSKQNYPILGDPVINPETGDNIFTADENGKINLEAKLHFGWYVLIEHDEKLPYENNGKYVLFFIGHDGIENIKFTNENRTVTFEVFKEDSESTVRLNGAEYTVWDISDNLDIDMFPTDYGEDGDMEDVDWSQTDSYYSIEDLFYIVVGQDADIYDIFIKGTAFEDKVANRPIYYELRNDLTGYISSDGIYHAQKPGYAQVDVYGGSRALYGTAGPITVYQGEVFDPYADIELYGDASGTDHIGIVSMQYTTENGAFTTDKTGSYTLNYTVETDEHIIYNFDRVVTVVPDNRHYCKYDVATDTYIWNDTKEPCAVLDLTEDIERANQPIVLLTGGDQSDDGWQGQYLFTFDVYSVLDDNQLINDINANTSENIPLDATEFKVDGIEIYKGLTGHKYIQTVNGENHNLPLPNQEVVIYYDEELRYPYRLYTSDELGMVDLNEDDYELLADYPEVKQEPDGRYYIDTARRTEYVDEQTGEILGYRWEPIRQYLNDNVDEGLPMVDNINTVYWYDEYHDEVREISLTQQDGRLELNNLKADRTYMICETGLPEGYDWSEDQNACFVFNTSQELYGEDDFGDKIYHYNASLYGGTRYNDLRRVDVVVYKYNENKTIKLDGAVFDVYDVLNEGEDYNHIDNSYADMNVHIAEDGTEYLGDALGATDKKCDDPHYIYDDEVGACVVAPSYIYTNTGVAITDWKAALGITEPNIEVNLETDPTTFDINTPGEYKLTFKFIESMTADQESEGAIDPGFTITETIETRTLVVTDDEIKQTVGFTELGTCNGYVDSDTPRSSLIAVNEYGHYLESGEGGACYVKYTPATVKQTYLGRYISGGIYIYDPSARYVEVATDANMQNVIKRYYLDDGEAKILGLDDGIYYTQLDNSNEVVSHYVAEGMIYLPGIEYGHTLLLREIEAPEGYYFTVEDTYITPEAPYGIDQVENYRTNSAVIIPQLGITLEDVLKQEN